VKVGRLEYQLVGQVARLKAQPPKPERQGSESTRHKAPSLRPPDA
jgi:hypothetical protein